jgi:hypothetical protein
VDFKGVSVSIGVGYNESFTDTLTVVLHVDIGRIAQLIYIPNYHHITGKITVTEHRQEAIGPANMGGGLQYVDVPFVLHDHEPCEIFTPLDHGRWEVEYLDGKPAPIPQDNPGSEDNPNDQDDPGDQDNLNDGDQDNLNDQDHPGGEDNAGDPEQP